MQNPWLWQGIAQTLASSAEDFLMLNLKHQADQFLSYVTSVFSCLRVMIRAGAMQSFCPLPHRFAPAGCGSSRPSEEGEQHPATSMAKASGSVAREPLHRRTAAALLALADRYFSLVMLIAPWLTFMILSCSLPA